MTNQSYVYGWLYGRLEWEDTLAGLHERARLARAAELSAAAPAPNAVSDEPTRAAPERPARVRRRSPIRGMSLRRAARKIPA